MELVSTFQLWFYFTVKYTTGIELLVLRSILACFYLMRTLWCLA